MISPCKGCKDRKIGCHAGCEAYKDFRFRLDEINKAQHKNDDLHEYMRLKRAKFGKRHMHDKRSN